MIDLDGQTRLPRSSDAPKFAVRVASSGTSRDRVENVARTISSDSRSAPYPHLEYSHGHLRPYQLLALPRSDSRYDCKKEQSWDASSPCSKQYAMSPRQQIRLSFVSYYYFRLAPRCQSRSPPLLIAWWYGGTGTSPLIALHLQSRILYRQVT